VTTRYETWHQLLCDTDGSAALPVLEPIEPECAVEPARAPGLALQLTNFLRDVADDLDLGREYLPREDLRTSDVGLSARHVDDNFVRLIRCEIDRAQARVAIVACEPVR